MDTKPVVACMPPFFLGMSKSYPDVKAKSSTKTPSLFADPLNEGYIAIRLGSPRPSTNAPSRTDVRQRFDRMGGYRLLSNRPYWAATF